MSAAIEERAGGTFLLTLSDGRTVESWHRQELLDILRCQEGDKGPGPGPYHRHCGACGVCRRHTRNCDGGHHRLGTAPSPRKPVSGVIEERPGGIFVLLLSDGRSVESRARAELTDTLACQSIGWRAAKLPPHRHCGACGICYRSRRRAGGCAGHRMTSAPPPADPGKAEAAPPLRGAIDEYADGIFLLVLSDGRALESRSHKQLVWALCCQQAGGGATDIPLHKHCRTCGMCFRSRLDCDGGRHALREVAARPRVSHHHAVRAEDTAPAVPALRLPPRRPR